MNEHLKETLENSEKDEEVARRIVLHKALETELKKRELLLAEATGEDDTDWIDMQRNIIRILKTELNTLND